MDLIRTVFYYVSMDGLQSEYSSEKQKPTIDDDGCIVQNMASTGRKGCWCGAVQRKSCLCVDKCHATSSTARQQGTCMGAGSSSVLGVERVIQAGRAQLQPTCTLSLLTLEKWTYIGLSSFLLFCCHLCICRTDGTTMGLCRAS